MTRARRQALGWLAVGTLGFLAVPWYALPDSVLGTAWLRDYSGEANAPALIQVVAYGRSWLVPLALLLAAGFGSALVPTRARPRPRDDHDRRGRLSRTCSCKASPSVRAACRIRGSRRHSARSPARRRAWASVRRSSPARSRCCSRSASRSAARSGAMRSSPAASSAVSVLVVTFTFYPVVTILVQALQDAHGSLSLRAFAGRLLHAEDLGRSAASSASSHCGVAWNTLILALLCAGASTALGLAFALIVTRTAFRYKQALRVLSILPIITPPFVIGLGLILHLRPLGRRQSRCSNGHSASSRRAGSTACRACSSRRCSRSRRSRSSC